MGTGMEGGREGRGTGMEGGREGRGTGMEGRREIQGGREGRGRVRKGGIEGGGRGRKAGRGKENTHPTLRRLGMRIMTSGEYSNSIEKYNVAF